ncbi:MAG TPA: tetratricopeptide repeat protein [Nitrolancea sp.]|nr:tetratricopeptide repeat protein [Nitrolancea sp.]
MESNSQELLGVLDAAIAKGVHQETVRRAIRAGHLPALRIGRNFVIRPADLQGWRPHYEKDPGRREAGRTPAARPGRSATPPAMRLGVRSRLGAPPSHNVTVPPTPLLGRERELEIVRTYLLSAGKRLVTLTGPGGAGKTRLALELAQQLVGSFEQGVWLVDLVPLRDAALIISAIAQTLDIRDLGRRPLGEVLVAWLRHRRLLLVLDNCEHLLAGMSEVATLLGACPGLRVLATSRTALHLAEEQVAPLHPLPVPDLARASSAGAVGQSPAVALFVQRASAVDPTFQLTDVNAPTVAEVCVRLDGLPLAIELAAARARVLSVEQIAAHLDDRFHLLTAGPRAALPRQQTLRATVDWSYALLSEPERALLRRLSVFAGGWTLEAAESVAAGDGVQPSAVLDLLAQLVDESLVIAEARRGAMRYRLLETIREDARDRLQAVGDAERTRDRHLAYYLALAEDAELKLRGAEYQLYLNRLEEEHANLRAALGWALASPDGGEASLRLSGALAWYWWLRSHHDEGWRWLQRALAGTADTSAARMKALYGAGFLAHHRRDSTLARALLDESLAIARARDDRWTVAWVLHHLGRVAYFDDDPAAARALGEESLAVAEAIGDRWLNAWPLHLLGLAAHIAGDYSSAREYYARSLAIRRELGYQEGIGILLVLLGVVALREGDLARAHALFREGVEGAQTVLGPWGLAMPLAGFAHLAAASGQPLRATRLGAAAAAQSEASHTPLIPLFDALLREGLEAARRALDEGAYAAAWAEGRVLSLEESIAEALAVEAGPPTLPPAPAAHPRRDGAFAQLTPAEFEVLRLLSGGRTTREIAAGLVVSISTVDRHLTHLYGKLGVRNRAEATAFALRHGLL